jgi:tRNA G18 (ribose-2'-O)-methylase SpoU
MNCIVSKDNKYFKELKKLIAIEGIKKSGKVIIAGKKQVKEAANALASLCDSLIVYDGYVEDDQDLQSILAAFSSQDSIVTFKKQLYNELDSFNTNAPLLVLNIPSLPEWDYSLDQGCSLLIPFQDPVNVGAAIRSAAGFGVRKIIMLKEAAHPFHPRSIRASAGAVFRFIHPHPAPLPSSQEVSATGKRELFAPSSGGSDPYFSSPAGRRLRGGETENNCRKMGLCRGPSINELETICDQRKLNIIALDMAGTPIESFHFPAQFILLPGLEGQGIPEALKASSISIPISGAIESLNTAIAASIALFAWSSQTNR